MRADADPIEHEDVLNRIIYAIRDVPDEREIDLASLLSVFGSDETTRGRDEKLRSAAVIRSWARACKRHLGERARD